jgi:hypothetical protein
MVFSRSLANNAHRATQSIGMLSFSFLRQTGHDDIVVPMVCMSSAFQIHTCSGA